MDGAPLRLPNSALSEYCQRSRNVVNDNHHPGRTLASSPDEVRPQTHDGYPGIHHFETSTTASWKRSLDDELDRKRPLGYHSNSYSWKGKERTPPFGQTARVCTGKQTNLGFSEDILPRQLEFSFFDGEVNVNFEWSTLCALGRRTKSVVLELLNPNAFVGKRQRCPKLSFSSLFFSHRITVKRMSVNTKMEHRTLAWVLVINVRARFFSVHLDSMERGKIDVLRKGLFHCGRLQSRGVKQENSADEACFFFFFLLFF